MARRSGAGELSLGQSFGHDLARTDIPVVTPLAAGGPSDAAEVLGTLFVGVLGVAPDWRVAFYNRASARALSMRGDACVGRLVWDVAPALLPVAELLRRSASDGQSRRLRVAGAHGELDIGVSSLASGLLVLEVRAAGAVADGIPLRHAGHLAVASAPSDAAGAVEEQNGALRELAHAMAVVADSDALVELLLVAAVEQCGADGALVTRFSGDEGTFIAASGIAAPLRGRRVLLAGTMLEDIPQRGSRTLADGSSLLPGGPHDVLRGPVLMHPLLAHECELGVLLVAREAGRPGFDDEAAQQLAVVADHASVALWKAHLTEEAQAANEAKSNFLATVSHELRTPLTTLTGYGELLADQILGPMPPSQLEVVERMRAVTHELTSMIDEILVYSSIEAGREIVRRAPASAVALAEAAAAAMEALARQKGLRCGITVPQHDETLATDGEKVRQVLVNLASNAVKFTDHGSVHLTLTLRGGEARFAVRDSGPGINEEDQARLFQPFSQLDGGLTRRHGGTGLGLYISERLTRLLGGRIEVESVPGNGSTFTLVLPAAR